MPDLVLPVLGGVEMCWLPFGVVEGEFVVLAPPGLVKDLKVLTVGAPVEGAEGRLAPL